MAQQKQANKNSSVRNRVATNGEVVAAEQYYEGPLPHPQILEYYDKIVPGSGQAIIDDFKKNTESIRELRKIELDAVVSRDTRGQWMAFILGLLTLIVAVYALFLGHTFVAGGAFFSAIAGIGAALLKRS